MLTFIKKNAAYLIYFFIHRKYRIVNTQNRSFILAAVQTNVFIIQIWFVNNKLNKTKQIESHQCNGISICIPSANKPLSHTLYLRLGFQKVSGVSVRFKWNQTCCTVHTVVCFFFLANFYAVFSFFFSFLSWWGLNLFTCKHFIEITLQQKLLQHQNQFR